MRRAACEACADAPYKPKIADALAALAATDADAGVRDAAAYAHAAQLLAGEEKARRGGKTPRDDRPGGDAPERGRKPAPRPAAKPARPRHPDRGDSPPRGV